jgi:hypothetical protein
MSTSTFPTFILVHGAWHGGWCYSRVARILRGKGYDVFTPTLTGLGERSHVASPAVNASAHVQDVLNVIEHRWLIKLVPSFEKAFHQHKPPVGKSWRIDETYIKVKGSWKPVSRRRQGGHLTRITAASGSF